MKKVSFKTLGCRLNQYETDALVTRFHRAGYEIVDFGETADVCVINTCTVTNQSDQKSRNTMNQAARRNPSGLLVITGCMANHYHDKLEADDKVSIVVDNEHKNQIVSLVEAHFNGEMLSADSLPGDIFGFETVDKSLHTRTSIKVQDGCNNFCSYCIVPHVRGRAVSRPIQDILDNVSRVLDNGFKEIVITGVNIGRYGDRGLNLEGALERILSLPGEFRVRISSMEPEGFGKEFHRLFLHPKMTPHLHLCIQSGSDAVLKRMHRSYRSGEFLDIMERFRKHIPDFNFTTDVIVGFPGETDEDFDQTLQLVNDAGFAHIHTFRYSRRAGTRADRMEGQVPEPVKAQRSELVRQVSGENRLRYMRSMLGKKQNVLVERIDGKGWARGYGEHYLPVQFRDQGTQRNKFHEVILEDVITTGSPLLKGKPGKIG